MRKWLLLVLAFALVFTLAACNTNESSDTSSEEAADSEATAEAPKLEGEITFLTHRTDKADNVLTEIANEFMEKNPGTKIIVEPNPGDDIVKTRIAGGEFADIMFEPGNSGWSKKDFQEFFEPIDDLGFTKDNTYYWANGTGEDGKLYLLSIGMGFNGVVYNKTAFEKAGIDKLPATVEEFYAASEKLKAAGIIPVASNFKDKWPIGGFAGGAYQGAVTGSSNFMNTLVDKELLTDEKGGSLEGMRFLKSLNEKGYLEADITSTNWDGSKRDMAQGKVAMMILGTWLPSQIVDNGAKAEEVGMFPIPGSTALVGGPDKLYGVTAASKNKPLAKAFFKYMWENGYMLKKIGMIPLDKGATIDDPFYAGLFESGLPQVEGEANSQAYLERVGKAELDFSTMVQEFVLAKANEEQAIIDKYNKKWADAKAK